MAKGKSWPVLGTLRRGESKETKEQYSYIKLADNVEIMVDGQKVPINKSRTVRLQDPRKNVEQMRDRGTITEKQADERLEKLSSLTWLRYELVLAPDKV